MDPQELDAGVLSAVPADARAVWFEAIVEAAGDTWAETRQAITVAVTDRGVAPGTAEEFFQYVEGIDPAPHDTMRRLADAGVAGLETTWLALAEQVPAAEQAEVPDMPVAQADWNTFLHEFGARWDRDDASWAQFRTWFEYEAEIRALGAEAVAFTAHAESTGAAAVFEQYGVPGGPAPADTAAESTSDESVPVPVDQYPSIADGDSGAWVAHLDEMLTRAGY